MALLQATYRDAGAVTVLDLSGRITLGEGSALLRTTIRELLEGQRLRILVNLGDINYIDSSGIGELVRNYMTVIKAGGEMKVVGLKPKVEEIFKVTQLHQIFQEFQDEKEALASFPENRKKVPESPAS